MNIRNTYWIVSLSLLLSLSLALPYCCHADISKLLFSHHQEMSSDVMHGQHQDAQQCDCGHEFVKDFQKTKKIVTGQNALPLLAGVPSRVFSVYPFDHSQVYLALVQPGILADTGPPLHVLNSVFLN